MLCSTERRILRRSGRRQLVMTIVTLAQLIGGQAGAGDGHEPIRRILLETFDRPEAQLAVDPLIVVGDHAIAGWTQDQRGGRVLLHRHAGTWMIVLCSGDGITTTQGLVQTGVPHAAAELLSSRLAEAEKTTSPDRRALFSTFDGTVLIRSGTHHEGLQGHR